MGTEMAKMQERWRRRRSVTSWLRCIVVVVLFCAVLGCWPAWARTATRTPADETDTNAAPVDVATLADKDLTPFVAEKMGTGYSLRAWGRCTKSPTRYGTQKRVSADNLGDTRVNHPLNGIRVCVPGIRP